MKIILNYLKCIFIYLKSIKCLKLKYSENLTLQNLLKTLGCQYPVFLIHWKIIKYFVGTCHRKLFFRLNDIIQIKSISHNFNIRGKLNTIIVPYVHKSATKSSFLYTGPYIYNNLPYDTRGYTNCYIQTKFIKLVTSTSCWCFTFHLYCKSQIFNYFIYLCVNLSEVNSR